MAKYIAKRLVYMVLVFFLLTFILFNLYQLMPANRAFTEARTEIQTMKRLTAEEKETKFDELYLKYRRRYGNAYELPSPNAGALLKVFHEKCAAHGMLSTCVKSSMAFAPSVSTPSP